MNNLQNIPSLSPALASYFIMFAGIVSLFIILMVVSMCFIFKKAGRQWWEAIIPFYNLYVLTIIIGQPWWILIGFFVPVLNWFVALYMYYYLSKRFGFDIPFTIGLVFVPFVFFPILAFGKSVYTQSEVKEALRPVASVVSAPSTEQVPVRTPEEQPQSAPVQIV